MKATETQYSSIADFIKQHLRYKQHWNKKNITLQNAEIQELAANTFLDNCVYAAGSKFKVFETANFGWIVFLLGTKTADGNEPNKRILKW